MLVLGIDPAIRNTGYGVIEVTGAASFRIVDCGLIRNKPGMPHSECLLRLAGGIRELADNYPIDSASIEDPFVGKNANTAIILGMARGAILATLAEQGIPCYAYSPRRAKKAAVGNGCRLCVFNGRETVSCRMLSCDQIFIKNQGVSFGVAICAVSRRETARLAL